MIVTPRNQPPVPLELRPERPHRLSMTWLQHFQRCKHSALLYLRHGGGPESHEMSRGSAYHEVRARCISECLEQSEATIPGDLAKSILAEVLADPRYTVPAHEWDYLRQCVFHFAKYTVLNVEQILAVEQLLVWDATPEWRISGKVDFCWADDETIGIQDDKTARWPLTQEAFNESFQTKLYALLLAYGRPVRVDENGTETVEDYPLGNRSQFFHLCESYPGVIWDKDEPTERIATRERTVTRAELVDEKAAVEALLAQVSEVFESGEWTAVPGDDQCGKCPARRDCPLPDVLLPAPGLIETAEEAEHFAMASFFLESEKKEVDAALKAWNEQSGPIALDGGYEYDVAPEKKSTIDKKKLAADLEAGTATSIEDYTKVSYSNSFRRRKVGEAKAKRESKAEADSPEGEDAGVTPPAPASDPSDLDAKYGETLPA